MTTKKILLKEEPEIPRGKISSARKGKKNSV